METGTRPTNEFNFSAAPSAELKRKLLYLAASGDSAVFSAFSATGGSGGRTPEERRRHEAQEFDDLVHLVLASRERIEQIGHKLDLLDQASAEALAESEETLRRAREELSQVRERAYEVTMPDGSVAKVYRDGDFVRNDSGVRVDSSIIKADDIPDSFPLWRERQGKEQVARDAARAYDEIAAYRKRLESGRERLESGTLSDREADKLEADIERMPASVRQHYERLGGAPAMEDKAGRNAAPAEPAATFDTDKRPTQPFAAAVTGKAPTAAADIDFTNMIPNVSMPAPK